MCSGVVITALPAVLLLLLLCFSCLLVELSAEHGLWMHINRKRLTGLLPHPREGIAKPLHIAAWAESLDDVAMTAVAGLEGV